jgi:hypothetical protein
LKDLHDPWLRGQTSTSVATMPHGDAVVLRSNFNKMLMTVQE